MHAMRHGRLSSQLGDTSVYTAQWRMAQCCQAKIRRTTPFADRNERHNGRLCEHDRPRCATIPLKCDRKTNNITIARRGSLYTGNYPPSCTCSRPVLAIMYWGFKTTWNSISKRTSLGLAKCGMG